MSQPGVPTSRQDYEEHQRRLRAVCAVNEADSGGRKVFEVEHPYRTCFQRDRDRIVHSTAFRRLDFKTQVFVPHEQDHFRTRLTHTLEVAQIARDLGRALRLNEDLIEAIALAHDLGHPPFGHGGEKVLDELMADHGGFEHNRQSLRIVEYLEHPYPTFRGLNLTRVVLECLAKHETKYDTPIGEEFNGGAFAALEGQVVDLADEIAYTAGDLEDSLASGLTETEQLSALRLWQEAWAAAESDFPNARWIHKRIRATKAVLAQMADDAVATTNENVRTLCIRSTEDVRQAGRRIAEFSGPMRPAVNALQEFLLENVYQAGENAKQTQQAGQILRQLFEAYVNDPSLLPERYRKRIDTGGDMSTYRVTCDYIAGMTDRFCKEQHKRICRR